MSAPRAVLRVVLQASIRPVRVPLHCRETALAVTLGSVGRGGCGPPRRGLANRMRRGTADQDRDGKRRSGASRDTRHVR
jgi:hypothetical protein